jgi:hypothetical protein
MGAKGRDRVLFVAGNQKTVYNTLRAEADPAKIKPIQEVGETGRLFSSKSEALN